MIKRNLAVLALGFMAMLLVGMTFQDVDPVVVDGVTDSESKLPSGIKGALMGLIGGVVAVGLGFFKNKDPKTGEMEKFDLKYAWPTLVVGAIVGVAGHYLGMTPEDLVTAVEASPIYGGAVLVLEMILKAIFRHSVPWIRDAFDAIKKGDGNPTEPPSEDS